MAAGRPAACDWSPCEFARSEPAHVGDSAARALTIDQLGACLRQLGFPQK